MIYLHAFRIRLVFEFRRKPKRKRRNTSCNLKWVRIINIVAGEFIYMHANSILISTWMLQVLGFLYARTQRNGRCVCLSVGKKVCIYSIEFHFILCTLYAIALNVILTQFPPFCT